ncbi:hypothetical protein PPL_09772 [Heterostelium album PN500]|uniref:Uncharacterized protein n=1 Tax=Heterostelium pallidum (strain ATCC 26659 / Pp 5 / PN500) TaxID=670386 RepID=D3BP10_HETP5|nr:hypothetical protein PPL_09772 [Heterostelium album PN500]EFA77020.1 hypothetical protein PPL_09772 [Heterostelium album PN500]|eukprot:XP_020429150.1 hypothetical protein PPL_09772 [Heterostelium album PN500]
MVKVEFIKIPIQSEIQICISSIVKILDSSFQFINQILCRDGEISLNDLERIKEHWLIIQTSSSFTLLSKLLEIKIEEVYYSPIIDLIAKYTNDILNNLTDPNILVFSLQKVSQLQNLDSNINDQTSNSYRLALRTINHRVTSMKENIILSLNTNCDQYVLQKVFKQLCEIKLLYPLDSYFSEPICKNSYLQTIEEIRIFIKNVEDLIVDSITHNEYKFSNSFSQSIHFLTRYFIFGENASEEEQQLIICIQNTKDHIKDLVSNIVIFNLDNITNGHWSTLSKQLQTLEIFKYNQICSTSSTIKTIESKIVEHSTTIWEQTSKYLSLNDYKSAYDGLNQLQRAQKFDNIKSIISEDRYSEIEETLRRSVTNFLSKMRSFIDNEKFNEFRTLQPQLNCLVDLENPSINTFVIDINTQFRESQNDMLRSLDGKINSRDFSGLKDSYQNLPEDSKVRLLSHIIEVIRQDEQKIMGIIGQIEQMKLNDEFSKSLSTFHRASIFSSILPQEFNFERRLKAIEVSIIKQIKLVVVTLKTSVTNHDFNSIHQYSNYIRTLCQQLRYCLSNGDQITEILQQVESIVTESLVNINEKMFEDLKRFSVTTIIDSLKKVKNNTLFDLKLLQIENFFSSHIVKKSESIKKMIKNGLILEAKAEVKNIEIEIQSISKFISTTEAFSKLEELKSFLSESEILRLKNITTIIKSGNFETIVETDLDTQTVEKLKEETLNRKSSIQKDLSPPPRFEQVAVDLNWLINMCSNSIIPKKLGISHQNDIDKFKKKILEIVRSTVNNIAENLKCDNIQNINIDHYYLIKTHLSQFIKDFNVIDKQLIESMKSYFKTFSDIISRNIDNWKKDIIPFEKNAISDLHSKLNTLRNSDISFSSCLSLVGKIPTYSVSIHELKSEIQARMLSFSPDLDSSKYEKSASTILLVYEVYNQLNTHNIVSSKDHPLLIGILHTHMEMLIKAANEYWNCDDLGSFNQTAKRATDFQNHFNQNRFPQDYSDRSPLLKDCVNINIKRVLDLYININGLGNIQQLGKELEISGRLGKEIISEFNQFASYSISMWNTRSSNLTLDYILENMTGDEISKELLKSSYNSFLIQYQTIVEREVHKYQNAPKNILAKANLIIAKIDTNMESEASRVNVISLLAHIFAMWTVVKSGESYVALKKDANVLLRPHHAQVLAIMRLLGIDNKESWLKKKFGRTTRSPLDNHLIEILTGEGKSITLAVLSILLSNYTAFKDIFSLFNVTDKITYSTFSDLCNSLIEEEGDVRTLTNQFINNKLKPSFKSKSEKPTRILLIDEVDVFFGDSFYGKTYNPSTSIQSFSIIQLVEYIWKNRKNITISTISNQNEYKKVMAEFSGHETILSQKIFSMVRDVNSYNIPAYEVDKVNQRIGYRDQDGISFTTTYGSKTAFAYIAEYELGNITEEVMKNKS